MTARPVPELPDEHHSGSLTFRAKARRVALPSLPSAQRPVTLQSRQQKTLTPYFPEIVAVIVQQIPAGTVLDGELVVCRDGRCEFAALQRRVSGRPSLAVAASFVAFDVLTVAGRDLRGLPHRHRRKRPRRLLADAAPPLPLMPPTRELVGAQAWMRDHITAGVEGVVVKHREHAYRPRRRCWRKVRTHTTADAVVGGVLGP
jgi:ATP-dependent DNA ligase